ncbi:hypothetical protein Chor_006899, partial [Crotalus horridus]
MADKLISATPGIGINELKNNVFYKFILFFFKQVSFCDAVDLVRVRKVYLLGGYAYVPQQDFVTIVLNNYRTKLSKALAVLAYKKDSPAIGTAPCCYILFVFFLTFWRKAKRNVCCYFQKAKADPRKSRHCT